jgi:hypothetical protein
MNSPAVVEAAVVLGTLGVDVELRAFLERVPTAVAATATLDCDPLSVVDGHMSGSGACFSWSAA